MCGNRFSPRRLVLAALAVLALAAFASPAAHAESDEDFAARISEETTKFDDEIATKAAELLAKDEWPKTGRLTERAAACTSEVDGQPFAPFGDGADYTLLPGGTFEGGAPGWLLENDATIVSANSSFFASGQGASAVAIPKGGKVTTSAMCLTEFHPTLRFFARADGSSAARLRVEVLYEDLGGSVSRMMIAYLKPTESWNPTVIIPLHVDLRAAVARDRTTAVAFRFSAEDGEGTWLIDDLYVDPYRWS